MLYTVATRVGKHCDPELASFPGLHTAAFVAYRKERGALGARLTLSLTLETSYRDSAQRV